MGIIFSRLGKKKKKEDKYYMNIVIPEVELSPYITPDCDCCSHFRWSKRDIMDSSNNNLVNVGYRSKIVN